MDWRGIGSWMCHNLCALTSLGEPWWQCGDTRKRTRSCFTACEQHLETMLCPCRHQWQPYNKQAQCTSRDGAWDVVDFFWKVFFGCSYINFVALANYKFSMIGSFPSRRRRYMISHDVFQFVCCRWLRKRKRLLRIFIHPNNALSKANGVVPDSDAIANYYKPGTTRLGVVYWYLWRPSSYCPFLERHIFYRKMLLATHG